MSKLIVGPFNRVEGDLEVRLETNDDIVEDAHVISPLYRGFEHILIGKDPRDALVYAPRICGICSVSQSAAAAMSLASAQSITPTPNGEIATNLVLGVENIADHLTHFYMFFMPDFARDIYKNEEWFETTHTRFAALKGHAHAQILPARAQFLHIIGLLAGKWPHTLAIQPGGTTKAIEPHENYRLSAILITFRNVLENTLFGADLDEICSFETYAELENWLASKPTEHSDFCRFMHISSSLNLKEMGCTNNKFLSYGAYKFGSNHLFPQGVYKGGLSALDTKQISEDVSHSWMIADSKPRHPFEGQTMPDPDMKDGYTWCKAPRLSGETVEVGALARQSVAGHPLICDVVSKFGGNVETRVLARLLEIAIVVKEMQNWVDAITLGEPFCAQAEMPTKARGVGLVEAARGSLGHWLNINDTKIENYQIVAPTTWNFSPRDKHGNPGPLEQALVGAPIRKGEKDPVAVQHIVRSFDPCMVCTVH